MVRDEVGSVGRVSVFRASGARDEVRPSCVTAPRVRTRIARLAPRRIHRVAPVALLLGCLNMSCSVTAPDSGPVASAGRTSTEVFATLDATAVVTLDGTASVAGSEPIANYEWRFGGEVIAEGPTAELSLPIGTHLIELAVIDSTGRVSTDLIDVVVKPPPDATVRLTISAEGAGTTLPPPGIHEFLTGTTVTVLAIPDEGYTFTGWTRATESPQPSVQILLSDDAELTAAFSPLGAGVPPRFWLPFAAGRTRPIVQGNNDPTSHDGLYAWDFAMPFGEPVLAAAAGRVVATLSTSPRNEPDTTDFLFPANFVRIDHGNGLLSYYAHLDTQGITVVPGQYVVAGQVIGYASNSGAAIDPQLHFEVVDASGNSVPSAFYEVPYDGGVPSAGDEVTSANRLDAATLELYHPSRLPADAFLINQIELLGQTPPAFFYSAQTPYSLTGKTLSGDTKACVALVDPDSFETVFCELVDVGADGVFVDDFEFPADLVGDYYLAVISGTAGAEGLTQRLVHIAPQTQSDQPVATIAAPTVEFVDFLQPNSLDGRGSESASGSELTYFWSQASGPPALIDDPSAPQTGFAIQFGDGIPRVSFQLVVSDGLSFSLPAEVEFGMPDVFFVKNAGVRDVLCQSPDDCKTDDAPPPVVSFSTTVMLGWIEAVNAREGDLFAFTVTTPSGTPAGTYELSLQSPPDAISFWRFVLPSVDWPLEAGPWTADFLRNGALERQIEFRVAP